MIEGDVDLSTYVRSEKDQPNRASKFLPNPTMYMFVALIWQRRSCRFRPRHGIKMGTMNTVMPGEISDLNGNHGG